MFRASGRRTPFSSLCDRIPRAGLVLRNQPASYNRRHGLERPNGKTDAQGNFRLTVSGVRRFFKERSGTPEARDKLLHDLGVRYRRNGEVYVVPV